MRAKGVADVFLMLFIALRTLLHLNAFATQQCGILSVAKVVSVFL